jgi:tripartite-type tricarboxylate transporter receptor subunit TctC
MPEGRRRRVTGTGRGLAPLGWLVLALGLALPTGAQPVGDPFHAGKSMRFVVGFTAGGGFDTTTRLLARHMGRHIPGHPAIVVENMPGAGSLIAANHLYRVAQPDGLTVGQFAGSVLLGQVLGHPGVEFDARRFAYLGAISRDLVVCGLAGPSGITSLDAWATAPAPVKLGALAPGAASHDAPRILRAALGLPIHLVAGYRGTAEIGLALEAGEVAGACLNWGSMRAIWGEALGSGKVRVVLHLGERSHPDLPGVPAAIDHARTEEGRRLIRAFQGMSALIRTYTLPPGTPPDRIRTLREALRAVVDDPAFLAEAERSRIEVDPVSGEEIERLVDGLFRLDPSFAARLRTILLQ